MKKNAYKAWGGYMITVRVTQSGMARSRSKFNPNFHWDRTSALTPWKEEQTSCLTTKLMLNIMSFKSETESRPKQRRKKNRPKWRALLRRKRNGFAIVVERKATLAMFAGKRTLFPRRTGILTRLCRIIKSRKPMMVTTRNLSNLPNPTPVTHIAGVYSAPTAPEHNKSKPKISAIRNTLLGMDNKVSNESTESETGVI